MEEDLFDRTTMIVGRLALHDYVGIPEHRLRRLIGLFDFPKPEKFARAKFAASKVRYNVWDKRAVDDWMRKNPDLLPLAKRLHVQAP